MAGRQPGENKEWAWRRWLRRDTVTVVGADEGYALWAPSYPPHPHNPLMVAEQEVMVSLLKGLRPLRALDLGTGSGRYLPILAATGAGRVVGLDLSLPMLLRGGAGAGARVCADSRRLPFADAAFDLLSSSLMVGDVADLGGWIFEAARVLVPGGHLLYSDFHPSWRGAGWRRTFLAPDGRQIELPYHPHDMSEHLHGLVRAGLHLVAVSEPRLPGRAVPVLAVFHAIRPPLAAASLGDASG